MWAAEKGKAPATVADAAKVLDLRRFPLLPEAQLPGRRTLAGLSYTAPATVTDAYQFQKKALSERGFKELPGGYTSDEYASGTFSKVGYTVSVSVSPGGGGTNIVLNNHGNIDFSKLPMPADAKPLFAGPVSLLLLTEASPDDTRAVCRKLLEQAGWKPYGTAGNSAFYKQNAIQLTVTASTAPAQMNKTVIDLQAALMSADIPAFPEAERVQYADVTTALSLDTAESAENVVEFYRRELGAAGWQATTEKPFKIGFRDTLIFRNDAKDLVQLETHNVEGKTRALVTYQTAEQVAETERKARQAMEQKAAAKSAPANRVALSLPADATDVKPEKRSVEFQLKPGKAKGLVVAWRKQFVADNWKEDVAVLEDMAGSVSLKRGEFSLTFTYVDTGFMPAEVSVQLIGGDLDLATPKQE